jgi:hypothetical protein
MPFHKQLLLFALIFLSGCAGGGGTEHTPPKAVIAGRATPLELQVSVWGSGWGQMTSRYRNVTCHYRLLGEQHFHDLPMMPEKEFISKPPLHKEGTFQCTLPAFPKTAKTVEYNFDFDFDGFLQGRPIVAVPVINDRS